MGIEKRLFVGIDESNHGRFPEIFVGVYSNSLEDIATGKRFSKKRSSHSALASLLCRGEIDFNFLIISQRGDIPDKEQIWEKVIYSLLFPKISSYTEELQELRLFIDGAMPHQQAKYLKEFLSDSYQISSKKIFLMTGKDLDRRIHLVNQADEIAHYLYRQPLELLSDHPHKIELQQIIS